MSLIKEGTIQKEKPLRSNAKHEKGKSNKGPNKQIALEHTNREKEDKKFFWKGVMIKTKEALEHKKHEQREKLW